MPAYLAVISTSLLFVILHSLTVSRTFKTYLSGLTGKTWMRAYYRLSFTLFSTAITAAAAIIIFSLPDKVLYSPGQIFSLPARAVQVAGLAIFIAANLQMDSGSFLGVRQALKYIRTRTTSGGLEGIEQGALTTAGVYGLVRHPMYTAGMMMFLFEPVITVNNLALRAVATAYFIFGMVMEERRFLQDYGAAYAEYQKQVPMFNIITGIVRKARLRQA